MVTKIVSSNQCAWPVRWHVNWVQATALSVFNWALATSFKTSAVKAFQSVSFTVSLLSQRANACVHPAQTWTANSSLMLPLVIEWERNWQDCKKKQRCSFFFFFLCLLYCTGCQGLNFKFRFKSFTLCSKELVIFLSLGCFTVCVLKKAYVAWLLRC